MKMCTVSESALDSIKAMAQDNVERIKVLEAALNAILTHMGMDEDEWNKPTFDQARAALRVIPNGAPAPNGENEA